MRPATHVPVVLLISLLAACGGGGGGDGTAPSTSSTSTKPVTVSASNYTSVANEATSAALDATQLSSDWNVVTGAAVDAGPNWAAWGLAKWRQWQGLALAGSAVIAGAATTQTFTCDSGNFSITATDANNNTQFDTGDSVAATFNNCTLDGETANGALTLVANSLSTGDLAGPVYGLDITMNFNNLTVVSSALTSRAHGALRLVSVRTAASTGTDSLSATSLVSDTTVSGSTRSRTLSSFTATVLVSPSGTQTSFSGTVASSALGGQSVSVSSTSDFLRRSADAFPYQGTAQAVGDNGGKAIINVIDNTQVSIALDANGDGSAEQSSTVPWTSLL